MKTTEEQVKDRVIGISSLALDSIEGYFKGQEEDGAKISSAFKMLNQATKVMHMNQVRVLTDRSQALRLLRWLPDDKARDEYIKLTNPQVAPLMLKRPG